MISRLRVGSAQALSIKRNPRRGIATVEFAVIVPLLVLLMMGMLEVTRAIQVKNYLTDAARSSCRLGIQNGKNSQNVTDNINAILTAHSIDPTQATITILVNGSAADVNTAKKYDKISVSIAIPISRVSWVKASYFSATALTSETMVMMHY